MSLYTGLLRNANEVPIFSSEAGPMTSSILSVSATLVALIASVRSKQRSVHWNRMAFWLILGDFFFFLPKVLAGFSYRKSLFLCKLFGAVAEFGGNSAFFWAPLFAHALYQLIKHRNTNPKDKSLPSYYFILAVGVPLPYGIAVMFSDLVTYNSETTYCVHITTEGKLDISYIVFAQIPLILACFPCIFYYIRAGMYLYKHVYQDKRILLTLALFPMILLVCWLPILISVLLGIFNKLPSPGVLLAFETLANLQGFFDAIVYGGTLKSIRLCCRRICRRENESHIVHYGIRNHHESGYNQF